MKKRFLAVEKVGKLSFGDKCHLLWEALRHFSLHSSDVTGCGSDTTLIIQNQTSIGYNRVKFSSIWL